MGTFDDLTAWLAEHGSGKVCVSISSHDADGRVVALACQPCGAALGDSQVIVSLDYSERLSLFVSEDELDDFGTAATRFCHEGKAKSVAEVMGFLAANIGPYLSSAVCGGAGSPAQEEEEEFDGASYASEASFHYEDAEESPSVVGLIDVVPSKLQPSRSYVVYDEEELLHSQCEVMSSVARTYGLSASNAGALLRHFKWDTKALQDSMRMDREGTLTAADVNVGHDVAPIFDLPADSSCDVCLEPLEPGRCFALSCKHWFCDGCWTGLVNTAVDGGKAAIFSAKCPQDGCSQTVKDFVFQRFLHGDFADRYNRIMLLAFVEDCDSLVRCPSPACSRVVGFSAKKKNVRCDCGCNFCFRCQGDAHAPASCDQQREWFRRVDVVQENKEKAKREAAASGTVVETGSDDKIKPCPNPACRTPTTKASGCMFMNCTKCGNPWCWQCGQWGPKTHHVWACNAAPAEGWGEIVESDFVGDDGKFSFYFERYKNHLDSLNMAEAQLQAARNMSTQIEEAMGAFVGDFVISAVQLLIRCRQTLSWTYVFGYFIKDNSVRKLFEFSQGQLESYTEKFSQMTEQHVSTVLANKDSITRWTQTLKQYLTNMEDYEAIADAMIAVAAAAPPRPAPAKVAVSKTEVRSAGVYRLCVRRTEAKATVGPAHKDVKKRGRAHA